MHRRGTVRASPNQHPVDPAVTFVTLPAVSRRARLNSNSLCELANQVFIPTLLWVVFAMDTLSLKEKAALCLRIARGLSWNNPSRMQLADLADRLDRQAREIELQNNRAQDGGIVTADTGTIRS
jgi:hypothetical protein